MATKPQKFPFEKSLKLCQDLTADALSSFEIFVTFRAYSVRKAHPKAFGDFARLFRALNPCVFATLILTLYKIGEHKTDRVTIYLVVKEAKDLKVISEAEYKVFQTRLKAADVLWDKVNVLRNRLIGHQSLKNDAEEAFKAADLKLNQLEELTGIFADTLNELAEKIGKPKLDWRSHADPLHLNLKAFLTKLNG